MFAIAVGQWWQEAQDSGYHLWWNEWFHQLPFQLNVNRTLYTLNASYISYRIYLLDSFQDIKCTASAIKSAYWIGYSITFIQNEKWKNDFTIQIPEQPQDLKLYNESWACCTRPQRDKSHCHSYVVVRDSNKLVMFHMYSWGICLSKRICTHKSVQLITITCFTVATPWKYGCRAFVSGGASGLNKQNA